MIEKESEKEKDKKEGKGKFTEENKKTLEALRKYPIITHRNFRFEE